MIRLSLRSRLLLAFASVMLTLSAAVVIAMLRLSDFNREVHAVTNDRDRVYTFLFGTRLTNITRYLRFRDVDIALDRRPLEDFSHLLVATDNQAASRPAPPQGLYLVAVRYPADLYAED